MKNRPRNSNIELLRIAAMFIIVIHHIVIHCVLVQMTKPASMGREVVDLFNHPVFYKKLLILDTCKTFGMIGNDIFILISGYFRADRAGSDVNMGKVSEKLLRELGFATLLLVCIPSVIHRMKPDIFLSMLSITRLNNTTWFVGYYFAVQLCGALFLNDFLGRLDHKKYSAFLLTLFAFISFSWSGGLAEGLTGGLRMLLAGIFMYALGGFIKRFDPFSKLRLYVFFLTGFVVYLLIWISSYNLTETNIERYIRNASQDPFIQNTLNFDNYSITIIILAVCLFEIFRRIQLPQSKVIAFLGRSTFMVYLIHDNDLFYELWNLRDWITTLGNSPAMFLFQLLKWGGYTFAAGVIAYALYVVLGAIVNKSGFLFIRST